MFYDHLIFDLQLEIIIIEQFLKLLILLFIPFNLTWWWFNLPLLVLGVSVFKYLRLLQFTQRSWSFCEIQILLAKYFTSFTEAFQNSRVQLILRCNIWRYNISKCTIFEIALSTVYLSNWGSECVNLVSIVNISWWM